MLITVVGCDATGKTTTIKALSKELKLPVHKGSSFEHAQCTQDELYEKFLDLAKKNNVILDRYYPCNLVYAPLYKDYAMISDEQRSNIEKEINEKTLLIYLFSDVETLTKRLNERGDDYVKDERIPDILMGYWNFLQVTELDHVAYFNTAEWTTDEIVQAVKEIRELTGL